MLAYATMHQPVFIFSQKQTHTQDGGRPLRVLTVIPTPVKVKWVQNAQGLDSGDVKQEGI